LSADVIFARKRWNTYQKIDEYNKVFFKQIDACGLNSEQLQQEISKAKRYPFDLEQGPLFRVNLFTRSQNDHILLCLAHTIILDSPSLQIILNELPQLYIAHKTGAEMSLSALSHSYADFVRIESERATGAEGRKSLDYWRKELGTDMPVLSLPFDYPRPRLRFYNGESYVFEIEDELAGELRVLAENEKVSSSDLFLAVFQVLLYRYTHQPIIITGVATDSRQKAGCDGMVGYFADQRVLRSHVAAKTRFRDFLNYVSEKRQNGDSYDSCTFSSLVSALSKKEDPALSPIFQVLFAWQEAMVSESPVILRETDQGADQSQSGWLLSEIIQYEGLFDLVLDLTRSTNSLICAFRYNSDLFKLETIARMAGHFQMLLKGVVDNPAQPIGRLPLLTEGEKQKFLRQINETKTEIPETCVHRWFTEQVKKTPEAIALVFSTGDPDRNIALTYTMLNERANQLAYYLQSKGVGSETLVGLCMERSLNMIIGIFGILKAGGAYIPLDPTYPIQRLAYMLENSQATVLLTQANVVERLPSFEGETVIIDQELDMISQQSTENTDTDSGPDSLACVIYTSGSTGKPKGVMITHLNLCNAVVRANYQFDLTPGTRVILFASFSFSMSLGDIFSPLCSGATLYIGSRDALIPGDPLTEFLRENRIDVICMSSSSLALLSPEKLAGVKNILVAGEPCPADVMRKWATDRRFFIGYGMTELTGGATTKKCSASDRIPLLGGPNPNMLLYILDQELQPVPVGVSGELYLGGAGLSRGYLNNPKLTKEKFIANPFIDQPGAMLCQTGDRARYLANGEVEFLSRTDFQINIRGFRIEPGEVEIILNQHPSVIRSVVIAKIDPAGNKRLVGYFVPEPGKTPTVSQLRDYLGEQLPEFMVPAIFVLLEKLPLTPNGKIDRLALPELALDLIARPSTDYTRAETGIEQSIVTVFLKILGIDRVGVNDNFFEIGADSLLLVRICDQLQTIFRLELPVVKLFEFPTIRLIGHYISKQVDSQKDESDDLNYCPERKIINSQLAEKESTHTTHLIVLSALNQDRLKVYAENLAHFLSKKTSVRQQRPVTLASVAYTLQIGRKAMNERLALIASTISEAAEKLTQYANTESDIPGLYTSQVKNGNTDFGLLLQGRAGAEYKRIIIEDRNLDRLAQLWVSGAEIEWHLLYPETTPPKIPLPTYPFAKQRYSIEPQKPVSGEIDLLAQEKHAEQKPAVCAQLYFESLWEKTELRPQIDASAVSGNILLFDKNTLILDEIQKSVVSSQVILVMPGEAYEHRGPNHYLINPSEPKDYQKLINSLQGQLPEKVIHFWSQEAFDPNDKKRLDSQLEQGLYSVFHLTKALMAEKQQATKPQTKILYAYHGNPETPQPQYAALYGFANSLRLEDSGFFCKTIEVGDCLSNPETLANTLIQEFDNADQQIRIRYANQGRFVRQLREFFPEIEESHELPLKKNGVYLITGGMGGLGLIFARYLATKYQAKLILTGRSGLSPEKQIQLRTLEALGAEVIYLERDVADQNDAKALIKESQQQFGAINGIIHSAGVIRRGFIRETTKEDIRQILPPKVAGTLYLDEYLKDEKLDFFVLFSSISAEIESLGLPGYAFANGFLDHFAHWREQLRANGKRVGKTLFINWPLWKEGGMQPGKQTEKILSQTLGMALLKTESGVNAFARGLTFRQTGFLFVEGNPDKIRHVLLGAKQARLQNLPLKESQSSAQTNQQKLLHKIQDDLLNIVATLLKKDQDTIELNETLYTYGFDSLSLTEFAGQLNEKYQLSDHLNPITPSVFFEHSTIASLSEYLLKDYSQEMANFYIGFISNTQEIETDVSSKPVSEPIVSSRTAVFAALRLATQHNEPMPIAIIGMSGMMPQSEDLATFWQHLVQGNNLVTEIPEERWDWKAYYGDPDTEPNKTNVKWGGFLKQIDAFDPSFFAISPREAELMDPQQRLFLETTWKCIEDGGYKPSDLSGTKTGVFVGVSNSGYREMITRQGLPIESYMATGTATSVIPNRISYLLNLHGPSEPIDTACSSSLVAVHRAVMSIRQGECETAIAGGVNIILSPVNYIYLSKAGMLSPDGRCSTFDKQANGFVRGEGVAAMLLKPLDKAIEDRDHIDGIIRGTAVNHGGQANSLTAPNTAAQAELLMTAYNHAKVDPTTISYIEAHGTGTKLGDPVEINALKKGFTALYQQWGKPMPQVPSCGLGAVKTYIGHLEAAAGVAGIIKTVLSMKHKTLPRNLHFTEINPYIDLKNTPFYIVDKTQPWKVLKDEQGRPLPRRAGVSSFGFGGANAHVIIEEFPGTTTGTNETVASINKPAAKASLSDQEHIFVFSAKNDERLRAYAKNMADFLKPKPKLSTSDKGTKKLQDNLCQIAADILKVEPKEIDCEADLTEYGFEPVTFASFSRELYKKYEIETDLEIFVDHRSIHALAHYLIQADKEKLTSHGPMMANTATVTEPHEVNCNLNPADVAYTLQIGRETMEKRLAIVSTLEGLSEKLEQYSNGKKNLSEVYTGSAIVNKEIVGLLTEDEAGNQFLKEIIKQKGLRKIASLWVAGLEIDWSLLYPYEGQNRIPLPTYPFARERYWIPENNSLKISEIHAPSNVNFVQEAKDTDAYSSSINRVHENDNANTLEEPPLFDTILDYITHTIATVLKVEPSKLDPDDHFESYGLDSILINQLYVELKKQFGQVSPTLLFTYKTINALAEYFLEHYPEKINALVQPSSNNIAKGNEPLAKPHLDAVVFDDELKRADDSPKKVESDNCNDTDQDIAIIGISGTFPMADNVDEFWENLKAGRDCVTEIPKERWDYQQYPDMYCKRGGFLEDFDKFDAQFFNISPNRARFMNPQERLFLQAAWSCIEDAGYTRQRLEDPEAGDRRGNVGVFAGVTFNEYQLNAMAEWNKGNFIPVNSQICSVANRVSYFMNLRGPSLSVDTACSASLYAIHLACESILRKECAMAIAGGVNLSQHPAKYMTLCSIGMLSNKGRCNAFGEDGDGMVPAEAVGAVLLKPLQQAIKEGDIIYATIKGTSVTHDGKTYGYTVPNPVAQTEVIKAALEKSKVDPRTISYVEAHGTGTALGDPIEIEGLSNAYMDYTKDKQYCAIGSVKSNIGHSEAAAGIVQLIKVILQMKHKTLVRSLLEPANRLNPNIQFENTPFYVQQKLEEWKQPTVRKNNRIENLPRRAGISSLGASGVNVHLILEEYPSGSETFDSGLLQRTESNTVIIPLSAMKEESLKAYVENLKIFLEKTGTRNEKPKN
jgi:amino acid adenylation domain-containing protein